MHVRVYDALNIVREASLHFTADDGSVSIVNADDRGRKFRPSAKTFYLKTIIIAFA
jgi:hypothetical protein